MPFGRGLSKEFGVKIVATFAGLLVLLHDKRMGFRVRILTNTGDLLRNFHLELVGLDTEFAVPDFARHNRLGVELPDHGV
jgi:hypothetical protein